MKYKIKIVAVVLPILFFGIFNFAKAAVIYSQLDRNASTTFVSINGNGALTQSFIAPFSGTLTSVQIFISYANITTSSTLNLLINGVNKFCDSQTTIPNPTVNKILAITDFTLFGVPSSTLGCAFQQGDRLSFAIGKVAGGDPNEILRLGSAREDTATSTFLFVVSDVTLNANQFLIQNLVLSTSTPVVIFNGSGTLISGLSTSSIDIFCRLPNDILDIGGGIRYGLCAASNALFFPSSDDILQLKNSIQNFQQLFPFSIYFGTVGGIETGLSGNNISTSTNLSITVKDMQWHNITFTVLTPTTLKDAFTTTHCDATCADDTVDRIFSVIRMIIWISTGLTLVAIITKKI